MQGSSMPNELIYPVTFEPKTVPLLGVLRCKLPQRVRAEPGRIHECETV